MTDEQIDEFEDLHARAQRGEVHDIVPLHWISRYVPTYREIVLEQTTRLVRSTVRRVRAHVSW